MKKSFSSPSGSVTGKSWYDSLRMGNSPSKPDTSEKTTPVWSDKQKATADSIKSSFAKGGIVKKMMAKKKK